MVKSIACILIAAAEVLVLGRAQLTGITSSTAMDKCMCKQTDNMQPQHLCTAFCINMSVASSGRSCPTHRQWHAQQQTSHLPPLRRSPDAATA